MPKHCWFCKNTEDFFLTQKDELIKSIEKELSDCEQFEKDIVKLTKEKLGFTDESKSKVRKIQSVYSEMILNAVLENKDNFIKLEPNLNIVLDYCLKYGKRNLKTVNEVIENYLEEPVESRYANELSQNEYKKNGLLQKKEKLESIKTFFIEKEITPHTLDSELQKLKRPSIEYNHNYSMSFLRNQKNTNIPEQKDYSFSYANLGFNFSKKIFICPICTSLFAESANASFDIIEAQRKAQYAAEMDDDWDDDDDW